MPTADRPNIIVFLSDDQGPWAMGCAGNSEIRTPNIDRLAATGLRFTDFFCSSPVCSPARATLLTGRIPSQHGVHDWIRSGNIDASKISERLRKHNGLGAERKPIEYLKGQTAYTDILAGNGYDCALSGKWHLGDSLRPQKGFSHWFTIARGGCWYYKPDVVRNGEIRIERRYLTDLITEDTLDYLDTRAENPEPFYLSVHYTAPHSPWDRDNHPKELYDSYAGCPFKSTPEEPPHPWQIPTAPTGQGEERRALLQGYYAAVTAMDIGIGQIIDKIEAMGQRQNTLIFFTSDNGMNMGHHGIWGKGNGTFPQNMFDTAVKVPAIFSHPGHVPEGKVTDAMVSQYDFMPTLLEYIGLENPDAERLPGKSFAPLLRGSRMRERASVVVFDEYGPVRMIRTREWKYVHRYPYGPHELYDLANDPEERTNLSEVYRYRGKVKKLKAELDGWFHRWADPAVDGTREAVYGSGQLHLAGPAGKSGKAFADLDGL